MKNNMELPIRCITFDKETQNNLPEHIKAKMKKHRQMVSKKCECNPDKTTGWIEEAGHKCCSICGQTQGMLT